MRCPEALDRIQLILDGEASHRFYPEFRRHLKGCPECRERSAAAELLHQGLWDMPAIQPPADFADKVVDRILAQQRRGVQRTRSFALAASVMIAAMIGWAAIRSNLDAPAPLIVEAKELAAPASVVIPEQYLARLEQVGDATAKATQTVLRDTALVADGLSPAMDILSTPLPEPIEASVAPLREMPAALASGVRPVTDSAFRAIAAIFAGQVETGR